LYLYCKSSSLSRLWLYHH